MAEPPTCLPFASYCRAWLEGLTPFIGGVPGDFFPRNHREIVNLDSQVTEIITPSSGSGYPGELQAQEGREDTD